MCAMQAALLQQASRRVYFVLGHDTDKRCCCCNFHGAFRSMQWPTAVHGGCKIACSIAATDTSGGSQTVHHLRARRLQYLNMGYGTRNSEAHCGTQV